MGASAWNYYVPYQADLDQALADLREKVLDEGDYWWAAPGEFGKSAADFPDRPRTEDQLWADEAVQESGTHSILDVQQVIEPGKPGEFGDVSPVTVAETGIAVLTREHVPQLEDLATTRWVGRCAVLHDEAGNPSEIYFWGFSGD